MTTPRRNQQVIAMNDLLVTEDTYGAGYTDLGLFNTIVPQRTDDKDNPGLEVVYRDLPDCTNEGKTGKVQTQATGRITLRMDFHPEIVHAFITAGMGISLAPVSNIHKGNPIPYGTYNLPSFPLGLGYVGATDTYVTEILVGCFVTGWSIELPAENDIARFSVDLVYKNVIEDADLTLPACVNRTPVTSGQVTFMYAGGDQSALFASGSSTIEMSNDVITDRAAREDGTGYLTSAQRANVRTQAIRPQVPVAKGHAWYTDAKDLAHRAMSLQIGTNAKYVKLVAADVLTSFDGNVGAAVYNTQAGRIESKLLWEPTIVPGNALTPLRVESLLPAIAGTFLTKESDLV